MIVSRTIARARIAQDQRPGWLAAWGPVAADAVCLALVMAVVVPGLSVWLRGMDAALGTVIAVFFALVFIPVQVVLITSAAWAAKSRWKIENPMEP